MMTLFIRSLKDHLPNIKNIIAFSLLTEIPRRLVGMTWFKSKCLCFSVNSSMKRPLAITRTLPEFNHIIIGVVEEFLSS